MSTIQAARERVRHMPCALRGCTHLREGLSPWCRQHRARAERFGHPEAPTIRPGALKGQRKEAEELLQANPAHPGLLAAERAVSDLMAAARAQPMGFKGAREWHRLASEDVLPSAVVRELAAAYLWLNDHPGVMPSDRAADFFLSRAVCSLAPRPRRPCGYGGSPGTWRMPDRGLKSYSVRPLPSALAHIGSHLRQTFAVLLANLVQAVEQLRKLKADPHATQRAPFSMPRQAPSRRASELPFP